MKNRSIRYFFTALFAFAFVFSGSVNAQEQTDEKKEQTEKKEEAPKKKIQAGVIKEDAKTNGFLHNWYVGVKGGATFFLSPLKDNPFSWGAGVSLGKQLNTKVGLRADYVYGNMKSDGEFVKLNEDGSYYKNNLSANVDFMEISLLLKLSLNDFFYSKSPKYLRELYLIGGGAYTMYRTEITDSNGAFLTGTGYTLAGEQEAMEALIAVPLGIGVTYKLGAKDIVNLNAEFGYRFTSSPDLGGNLTDDASNYTFSSLGLLFNLGRPGLTPQKITADMVREDVEKEVSEKFGKQIDAKIKAETKPIKDDLAKQSVAVANNQEQLNILQEELEARTNAIKEQLAGEVSEDANGNMVVRSAGSGSGIDMTSIYFAFNSTYITPAMEREIAVIGKMLKKNKKLKCEVVGNASNVGSPEYNMQLSQKRAEAVMNMLIDEFKIDAERLTLSNNGLDEPLAENIKRINRRVDLIIQ
ncbi:OmpA family protein [Lentimicrobium sp. L6]|uniref:OmpA family protein n=1 Tax=Lentimicrobium sp. L6 TaxID=2735916 RepID=UPI00155606F6|nr:OmpA family protein [Lentimicrobium sp. L6]NPD83727.1 OmpA family protein [Lentimicrobium sp. L6]